MEQAKRYAKAMKDGWPGIDGVMYIVENKTNADKIAKQVEKLAGGRFVVGYFDEAGKLKWK